MCEPDAQAVNSAGEALLIRLTKWKSWNDALPAPPPPPPDDDPEWLTPHDHDSTSISSLCVDVGRLADDPVELEEPALGSHPNRVHDERRFDK